VKRGCKKSGHQKRLESLLKTLAKEDVVLISAFLSRVSILLLTRDIDIAILSVSPSVRPSVCLSVCLSVTRWYCMKTA